MAAARQPGKNKRRTIAYVLTLLLACTAVFGCSGKEETHSTTGYKVYYLSQNERTITGREYVPYEEPRATAAADTAGDTEGAEETEIEKKPVSEMTTHDYVTDMLRQETWSDQVEYVAPLKDIAINSEEENDKIVTLDIASTYRSLTVVQQVLIRAAIVNTLCQLDGVKSVTFLVDGQPMRDAEGNTLGTLTPDDFISSSGSEIQNYERVRLHLYFANETGDRLIDTYRNVVFNSNISMERLVVEQIIMGPNSDVVYPTINPDTKILSVTTRDGVCYVNLDESFLTEPYNVTSTVAVYSVVNSLTQLPTVHQVQISIGGDTSGSFMDNIRFQNLFEFNGSVVAGSAAD